jgi:hypothetical protein
LHDPLLDRIDLLDEAAPRDASTRRCQREVWARSRTTFQVFDRTVRCGWEPSWLMTSCAALTSCERSVHQRPPRVSGAPTRMEADRLVTTPLVGSPARVGGGDPGSSSRSRARPRLPGAPGRDGDRGAAASRFGAPRDLESSSAGTDPAKLRTLHAAPAVAVQHRTDRARRAPRRWCVRAEWHEQLGCVAVLTAAYAARTSRGVPD